MRKKSKQFQFILNCNSYTYIYRIFLHIKFGMKFLSLNFLRLYTNCDAEQKDKSGYFYDLLRTHYGITHYITHELAKISMNVVFTKKKSMLISIETNS